MTEAAKREHWETVWSERDPTGVSWYQPSASRSFALVTEAAAQRTTAIIDVGGGASPLAGQLLEAGYDDITVLDIAQAALDQGRARLGDRADDVTWIVSDATRFAADRPYGLWHDRAVLHFLTDAADAARYVHALGRAVGPGGHVVIATFGPEGPTSCSGLPVQRYDEERLTGLLAGTCEPVRFEAEEHHTPSGGTQQFLYGLFRRAS